MALRNMPITYRSRNGIPNLTDIKGQVYFNKVAKGTAVGAISFADLDSSNAVTAGIYYSELSADVLKSYGAVAGASIRVIVVIDSASQPAQDIWARDIVFSNTDDIVTVLGTPSGASLAADIAEIKKDTAAIKIDLESGPYSLKNIYDSQQSQASSSGFALTIADVTLIPPSGSVNSRVYFNVYGSDNRTLIDIDDKTAQIVAVNQAGEDRTSVLVSNLANRMSMGIYYFDYQTPSTAPQEAITFFVNYKLGGKPSTRTGTTRLITDVQADGFALQNTLLKVQTDVASTRADVQNGTTGIAAAKAGIDTANQALIKMQGSGFTDSKDSLHALGEYLRATMYSGGRAV